MRLLVVVSVLYRCSAIWRVQRKKSHRLIQTNRSPPSYKSTRTPRTPEEMQSDVLKSIPNIHV